MNTEEIKNAVIDAIVQIAPEVEGEEIAPEENLQRSLEIDSFDFLKILTALHEKLGVEVPESDYEQVQSLQKMVDYFAQRL
jgi:acyl carrier protein